MCHSIRLPKIFCLSNLCLTFSYDGAGIGSVEGPVVSSTSLTTAPSSLDSTKTAGIGLVSIVVVTILGTFFSKNFVIPPNYSFFSV